MNEQHRHSEIVSYLKEAGQISIQDLVEHFSISPATARRDINKLNETGRLKKVRNGAVRIDNQMALSVGSGLQLLSPPADAVNNSSEKERIAEAAAGLCQEGESVIINCGTTAFMMGSKVIGRDLQVITNYLPLANHLIGEGHGKVVILGGQYYAGSSCTLALLEKDARLYSANYMFTSGAGLTEQGLTKIDPMTVMIEQKMSRQAGKLVVLVDSSKLGVKSGLLFCKAEEIDILITGRNADLNILRTLEQRGIELILA